MRFRIKNSLPVILISACQLVFVLLVVGYLSDQTGRDFTNRELEKAFDKNRLALVQCKGELEKVSSHELGSHLAQMPTSEYHFLVLIDQKTGRRSFQTLFNNEDWKQAPAEEFRFVSSDGHTRTLAQFVDAPSFQCGEMIVSGQPYLTCGISLQQHDATLLIARNKADFIQQMASANAPWDRTVFGLFLAVGLVGICLSAFVLKRYEKHLQDLQDSLEAEVITHNRELVSTQKAVIYGLAKLAESRDNDTGDHLLRIQKYVTVLAKALRNTHPEIDEDYIRNLSLASSLHDIGKVGVPDAILLKPGRLTQGERSIMELHTVIGGDCLKSIQSQLDGNDFLEMATQIAYSHHERWDGDGYPNKVGEWEIPLSARIVSVADVYDALRTKRPYKDPMTHERSKDIILGGMGTQFDPEVVNAFLRNEAEFERISEACSQMTEEEVTPKIKLMTEMLAEDNAYSSTSEL